MAALSHVVEAVRAVARAGELAELPVEDLRPADLAHLGWSGSSLHLRYVEEALARAKHGEVEYLVVRAPSGEPIAKGGIDFTRHDDAGTLWQLATHPELQGLGIGSLLVGEALRRLTIRQMRFDASSGSFDEAPR